MQKPNLFDPSLSFQPVSLSAEPDNLLRHQDSYGELEDSLVTPHHIKIPTPTRQSTLASTLSGYSSHSEGNAGLNLAIPSATETSRPARSSFGSEGCTSPTEVRCQDPNNQCPASGIAYTVPQPPRPRSTGPEREGEKRTSEAERRKLREFYEKEGWLPAPQPSRVTRLRRKRAM